MVAALVPGEWEIATAISLPIAYLAQLFWGSANMGFGTGAGYFAITWVCGPSLLLYAISRLLPKVRRVICLRCSWNERYPLSGAAPCRV